MRNFENVRRTKDVVDESIRYSALQFVDQPITTSLITSLTESVNLFLRKLIGDGALLGGECWYDPARNPHRTGTRLRTVQLHTHRTAAI
ncbi:phage tail sheath C-terminal domain-containing protein [Pseudomonas sp. SIMBA_041]|uniref:phage tail sheath C-terminal domain-containing protein n=1 Tax=Pseudomonas sp. SIMBA_041 TaxID=3085782 RepID=UPI00397B5E93